MPLPSRDAAAVLLNRFLTAWPEPTGLSASQIASQMGPSSFADIFEFCQNIRRRHILSQGRESLKSILAEELRLWKTRIMPDSDGHPPKQPLLRLGAPATIPRKTGGGVSQPRKLVPGDQARTPAGQKLAGLAAQLDANTPMLQLRADPDALAPERLLVFELTGGVMQFTEAVRLVPGVQFLGAEDLDEDELDSDPVVYLMVPSEAALRNIVTLWRGWQQNGTVPYRFGAWKMMLSQLRNIRPWGPQDRVTNADHDILVAEYAHDTALHRVEVELVFRRNGEVTEAEAHAAILAVGGAIISRSRITGAGYHALLADLPGPALADVIDRNPAGLAGVEAVLQIRPQSLFQLVPSEEVEALPASTPPTPEGDPIAAIFDAVPLSQHPRLAGALSIDDPFDLEGQAVGMRTHGTAMASAVVHGDIYAAWERPLERRVHFVNMLYASSEKASPERFPDLLPADMLSAPCSRCAPATRLPRSTSSSSMFRLVTPTSRLPAASRAGRASSTTSPRPTASCSS